MSKTYHRTAFLMFFLTYFALNCCAEDLIGAGATFPYPLYSKWIDVYNQETSLHLSYQAIGSGGGVKELKNRKIDFAASDVPLNDASLKEMPGTVEHIPTVAGAVAVVYNLPTITQRLRLSGEVIAEIYLGKITRWNDRRIGALNPRIKLPNIAIIVVHRADRSGTNYI